MQSPDFVKSLSLRIDRYTPIARTPRVLQLEGMFDIPPAERSGKTWEVSLPLAERPWNIGLIVGPSGSGKSTLAREVFGERCMLSQDWAPDRAIIDCFPAGMSAKDVVLLLSSVGFSSPPCWLRPFHVLSTGEQFRASIARAMAEAPELLVVDEFTSVVDRQVAQVGSAAIAKTIRRREQRFVAVTCHYDVEDWLDPDWVFNTADGRFSWRSLRGRPKVEIEIARVHHSAWRLFSQHHYLTAELHHGAVCFCAFIRGHPVAFQSYLPFVGHLKDKQAKRGHRSVTLPDYQGLGIGNALITTCASMWAGLGYRVFRNTGHPAEISSAKRDKRWTLIRSSSLSTTTGGTLRTRMQSTRASDRLTTSFEYCGPPMERGEAKRLLSA